MADAETDEELTEDRKQAPDPDDPAKPASPGALTKASWRFVSRKTARKFSTDQCGDLAAALTYYAVLSLFPALLVLVTLLGLVGQDRRTTEAMLEIVGDVAPASVVDQVRQPIQQIIDNPSAGWAFALSVTAALWSASGYVGAFGRAVNRIYEVAEGRPVWKLRPLQLVLTLAGLVLAAAVALMLAVSGPLARAIGTTVGLSSAAQTTWAIAKWPVILVFVTVAVAVLYYAVPNVEQPTFRWLSTGSVVAIVTWIVASIGFGFYVGNFGSYNKTYGALAGVIVFLLWLWITNVALLFGAELDAELERGRQLQAGIAAERHLQLPPKDTYLVDRNEAAEERNVTRGQWLRRTRGQRDRPA